MESLETADLDLSADLVAGVNGNRAGQKAVPLRVEKGGVLGVNEKAEIRWESEKCPGVGHRHCLLLIVLIEHVCVVGARS